MRRLTAMGTLAILLVAVATLAWGWPGLYALTAIPAAILLGGGVAHGIDAAMLGTTPRLGVIVLGGTFGTLFALASIVAMWAANAPPARDIVVTTIVLQPVDAVWPGVEEPTLWARWDRLIGALEPVDAQASAEAGARYDTLMVVGGQQIPARYTLASVDPPRSVAWQVDLPEGTAINDLSITLTLEPIEHGTRATYRVAYRVPTVMARAIDLIVLHKAFGAIQTQSLQSLAAFSAEHGRGR